MIATHDLVKEYGQFRAVDGVSLDVPGGQIHGFLGPNGAGKTTTIRLIAGLLKPTAGRIVVNGFDLALLIPYFIVLIILAAYGAHRYWLVYLYYKNKKNKTTDPTAYFDELPRVTVQLPIFNEQYVVDRLLDAVCKLEYPREKLDIQLLDDSTDETIEVARQLVERYAALGHPVYYLHRDNRAGYKAGALEEGLKTAKGEFVAIFDADFVPPPDRPYGSPCACSRDTPARTGAFHNQPAK